MRTRFERDLTLHERCLFLAVDSSEAVVGWGRVGHFVAPPDAPVKCAPDGHYMGGLLVGSGWRRRGIGRALTSERLAWVFERSPEVWYFTNARNLASLALHESLGFVEVTRDFVYPGVSFDGGVGVLGRAVRAAGPGLS